MPHAIAPAASIGADERCWRVFGALGVGFWVAIFIFFYRVLRYFLSVPDFGPVLTYKLLSMVLLTFFSILLFSNIITALSTFFLVARVGPFGGRAAQPQHASSTRGLVTR